MGGPNRCSAGEANYKKARAIALRKAEPNLTARDLSERLNVPFNTMRVWLQGQGEARTEDARGLERRMSAQAKTRAERDAMLDAVGGGLLGPMNLITPSSLDNLNAFSRGDLDDCGVTASPRNTAVPSLCPDWL
ncbi:MAG TPA: hypothetical protein VEZ71_31925 [Archangium sp.]|nr:hypothetical protein [Archangium sp.]